MMAQLAVVVTTPAVNQSRLGHSQHVDWTDAHVHDMLSTQRFNGLRQQRVIAVGESMSSMILLTLAPVSKHGTIARLH